MILIYYIKIAATECADIHFEQSGVFTIAPIDPQHPMLALCVIEVGQKWTVREN